MDPFEFIMVLVSIIMGLGIANLLRGAIRSLRPDTETAPALVHTLWVAWVFVMHVGVWAGRWGIADRTLWSFWDLLGFLFVPILLFTLAELAFPLEHAKADLMHYYFEIRGRFFCVAATLMLAIVWSNTSLFENPLSEAINIVLVIVSAIFVFLAWVPNRRLHLVAAVLALIATLYVYGTRVVVAASP